MQSHKVPKKTIEVTEHIQELLHNLYITGLFCKFQVLGHQSKKFFLPVILKVCLACIQSESLYASACLGSLPSRICGKLRSDLSPISLSQHLLLRRYHDSHEGCELRSPSRIYRRRKIQLHLVSHSCERIRPDLSILSRKILCTDRLDS